MKKALFFNMICLSSFSFCFGQPKLNEADKRKAVESDVMHFFACMTNNVYYEKIAKNNYYIFDTVDKYLYYGKMHSGFFKGTITYRHGYRIA
jgi:hypothetical protein